MKFENLILWMFSPAGKLLWRAAERPEDWDEYKEGNPGIRVVHKPSNTHWWIASGAFFFDGANSQQNCLNFVERNFLYRKVMKAVKQNREVHSPNAKVAAALLRGMMGDK